ncbi:hsp70-binding protein 1 isoform X1 [Schistocerca americana]|uniref:hsp70-binding protein 1 isoform X1 n=1 Tax=Schistocerca americana TaxID=7009 RepID=UPI001F4F2879|nr:hsp70-binding protein 1 isoform X1 [Schistocerca americana]XP_047098197.1 hsp70-binding protein 1 isoform X1 [Schistocerca piceifrons]XP_049941293.1 hsp70-binding protein 1 isoform X1 [Schistocerca serialis cubense]
MSSDNSGAGENVDRNAARESLPPAIEYPGPNNITVSPNQPRQPTTLQDLLRFSVEAAGGQMTQNNAVAIDEERRKFLEAALKSLTFDVIEELLKAINILKNAGTLELEDDPSACEAALDTITQHVDNMDTANDFHKIGGFCIFHPCLDSAHSSLRWRAAEIIAELTQNNPYCQQRILEANLLQPLLNLIDNDPASQVRVKALYAISCLVRENKNALQEFIKHAGYSVLLRAMQSNVEKLQVKSAFLLSSLCSSTEIKDELCKMGFIEQLIGLVGPEGSPAVEHLLSAVVALVSDHELSQQECRRPELHLRDKLFQIMQNVSGKEEFREIREYAQYLLRLVFSGDEEER